MLSEHDVTTLWRRLFHGQEISPKALVEAETMLEDLNPESPLRLRLTTELDELRKMRKKK